jgi:predicted nucleotidyltransferase
MDREVYIETAKAEVLALARSYPVVAAFVCGSIVYEEELGETDVDVRVILDGEPAPGFFVRRGDVPLEVTFTCLKHFLDDEQVLSHPILASDVVRCCIIYDPTGMLAALRERIRERYSEERYLMTRAWKMFGEALEMFRRSKEEFREKEELPLWTFRGAMFRAGEVPLILLDIPLTHRRLFVFLRTAARMLNDDEVHGFGLETLGSSGISKNEATKALEEAMTIFDIEEEPRHFYLSPAKRSYWENGVLRMMDEGLYAEAIWPLFTLVALRCTEDPGEAERFWLLDRLGFSSPDSMRRRLAWMDRWLERIRSHLGGTLTTLLGTTRGSLFLRSTINGLDFPGK